MPRTYRADAPLEIRRPEHFREAPEERTEINPAPDYPSAQELGGYEEDPREVDQSPLAVDIGQPIPQPKAQDWSAGRIFVDETKNVQIAGDEPNRTRFYMKNDGDNSVFIGRNETDSLFAMYEVATGESVELWSQGPVWARCNTSESATLSVLQEYVPASEG